MKPGAGRLSALALVVALAGCGNQATVTPSAPAPDPGRLQDFVKLTTAQAAHRADRVALVRAGDSRVVEGMPGTPFTRTAFTVEQVEKGRLPRRFVIQVIGGRIGDAVVESPVPAFVPVAPLHPVPRPRRPGGPDDLPAVDHRGERRRARRAGPGQERAAMTVKLRLVLAALACSCWRGPADAYQFFAQNAAVSGVQPDHWASLPINLRLDGGPTDLSSEIATAVGTWNAVPTAKDPFGTVTSAAVDFDETNLGTAWGDLSGDGKQEVVVDETGNAIAALGFAPAGGQRLRAEARDRQRRAGADRRHVPHHQRQQARLRPPGDRDPRAGPHDRHRALEHRLGGREGRRALAAADQPGADHAPVRDAGHGPPHARGRRRRGAFRALSRADLRKHGRHDQGQGDAVRRRACPCSG